MITAIKAKVVCFSLLGLLLLGCANSSTLTKSSQSRQYDGKWVGDLKAISGSDRCDISRVGLRFDIRKSTIVGSAKRQGRSHFMRGLVNEDGMIEKASIDGAMGAVDEMILTGAIDGFNLQGAWSSKYCKGEWQAVKTG